MKKVKLGEVCDVFSGYAFKSFNEVRKGKPVIKIGNVLSNGKIEIEDCSYTEEIPQNKYLSQKNDIYVALSGATTGKVGLMQKEGFLINQRVGVVRLKNNEVPINYIYSFLQSKTSKILEDAFGAAQPNISPKDILNYEIFIGENAEMQAIADRLDEVSSLIEKRKTQLTKLDQLIKSRFIEMFGEPESNPLHWKMLPLENCLTVLGGFAFKSEEFKTSGVPVLRIGNINTGVFTPTNMVYWSKDASLERYQVLPGDLVISLTGTVGKDDYGNVCILGNAYPLYYLNQRNAKLILGESLNKHYLSELLKFSQIKKKLTGISRGVRQANISNRDILNLVVPIPPIEFQTQFASFVEQIDKSKFAVQKSIDKLEILKKSLMQHYFG